MARRRRGGLLDAGGADIGASDLGQRDIGLGDIEILDLDAGLVPRDVEVVEREPASRRSNITMLVGLVVGGLATLGVVTAGNTPAPEPPAPSVTVPPDPIAEAEAERQAEIAELEATYGVEIGDGPALTWHPVVWNIKTNQFQWIEDGFVGHNGETEWTIRPGVLGPSVGQRQSPELDAEGYRLELVDGARVLVPDETSADHLLVLVGDQEPIRVDLPPSIFDVSSDLVSTELAGLSGAVVDERLVLTTSELVTINRPALAARTGRDFTTVERFSASGDRLVPVAADGTPAQDPIVFEDAGFTEAEVAGLRLSGSWRTLGWSIDLATTVTEPLPFDLEVSRADVLRTATGAAVRWADGDAQEWLSTSTDGDVWSTAPFDLGDQLFPTAAALYSFPFDGSQYLRRSTDIGRTWQRTRMPFPDTAARLAIDDVLLVAEQTFPLGGPDTVDIDIDDYEITITGGGRAFELVDPATGEIVLSGSIEDSASGAAFDPFGSGLAITDPASGEQLLTIPQGTLLQAYASISGAEPPDLAITEWAPSADDPEWRIEPLAEVFPNAVAVDFVPGDGQMLAIVTTPRGYDFYVARTAAP